MKTTEAIGGRKEPTRMATMSTEQLPTFKTVKDKDEEDWSRVFQVGRKTRIKISRKGNDWGIQTEMSGKYWK